MKTKLLILSFILIGFTSQAQITVDSSDVVNPGSTRYQAYFDNYSNAPINPGTASASSQNWDFSYFTSSWIDTLIFTTPANADFPTNNPNANLSMNFTDGSGSLHFVNSVMGLFIVEYSGTFGSFPVNETWANFPMTYGSSFSSSATLDTIIENSFFPMPGADIIYYKKDTFQINEVDAFGEITTPLGVFDALRVRQSGESTDSIWYKSMPTSHVITTNGMLFSPDTLSVNILDTVYFTNLAYHNAVEVDENIYLNNGTLSNGGFSFQQDSFHVFTESGNYYYVCQPHASMGMKGMVTVIDDWTLFQTSSIDGEDNYSFWTNDADTAGMPLVSLYSDSLGNIVDAEYLAPNSVSETWNCTGNACVDPGDGSGQYNDMIDCMNACTNSSIEIIENMLDVYPNPASTHVTFEVENPSVITVYSSDGKLVLEKTINRKYIMDVQNLATGLYFYQISNKDEIKSSKFQVIK